MSLCLTDFSYIPLLATALNEQLFFTSKLFTFVREYDTIELQITTTIAQACRLSSDKLLLSTKVCTFVGRI